MKAVIECIGGLWTVTHNGNILARSKKKRTAVNLALDQAIRTTDGNERIRIVEKDATPPE